MRQFYLVSLRLILFLLTPTIMCAQEVLEGKTINEATGEVVPFVNVIEKGTTNGTTSDFDGNYSLSVESLPTTLVFSYLGFETQEIRVTSNSPMTVQFVESSATLDEVVVTGLATSVKRANAANAVSSLSASEISGRTPPPTLDGALYGKFAGATVSANSGAPGGGLSVKLRGATSIQGNTQPLYIIDGVYIDNSSIAAGLNVVSAAAAGGSASNQDNPSNRIADINPEDIANIEILKGASAAAIYGSRAAAGVVIITTKKGKAGETIFNFSQATGWTEVNNLLGLRDYNEQRVRDSFGDDAAASFLEAQQEGRLVDYEKEIFGEKGLISITNFSMSGGSEKTRFYTGITHNDEEGIVKGTGYKKTSLRLNLDHRPTDFIKLGLSSSYAHSSANRGFFNNDNSGTTIGVTLTGTTPWLELFPNEDGVYPDNPAGASNPLQTRDQVRNNETVNRFIVGGTANIDIYKAESSNLELILRGGLDFYGLKTRAIFPKSLQFQKPSNGGLNGVAVQGDTQNKNYNLSAFLVHNYFTGNDLNFRTQAGVTRENFDRNTQLISATGLVASETNVDQAANTGVNQTRLLQEDSGFFVQEEVNFQDKVIATVGLRGDKSSNNGDANELYYYPKASVAVNLNEFGFWNENSPWSQFKLRAAYGEAGNFPPFGALFTSYNTFSTDGLLGISLIGVRGDRNLESERQKELEFGTDVSFFNNRLNFSATYYIKTIENLILQAALEPSSGFTSEFVNAGELRNRGIELTLDAVPVATEDFTWNLGVNFYKNTSEITRLDVDPFNIGAFGATLGTFRIEEGSSATQIVGIGPNPGENGFQKFGDAEPDFQMGFNSQLIYKNFDLSFVWQWKNGGENVNLTTLLTDLNGTSHDYDTVDLDPDGQVGNGPYRVSQLGSSAEVFVEDASYLRMRELGLYYNIPAEVYDDFLNGTIDNIKLGFSGTNLINIFDYNSYDPEVSNFGANGIFTGVDVTPFPSSKRFLFHLAVNF
ncbi:SusC/RagA family TonB-linked outer membrane protein [Christiangramia sp. OXR-203]|uniref:SusC/RagA family TonB-linked outer membrane protein n=1 Tax=Christiangramia sp. OXR-203 TaxID=3100176 RepID=UPI002AC9CDBC|nr:SusC/RagA family TonB-linked outer membrane protein [Christiangramia sp. OXR-203]WPY98454.1 SusC/RagA family TonB-linked outer membrane protein [Christiangramia sp. OXR-203]